MPDGNARVYKHFKYGLVSGNLEAKSSLGERELKLTVAVWRGRPRGGGSRLEPFNMNPLLG
jgi:hypothetical protein